MQLLPGCMSDSLMCKTQRLVPAADNDQCHLSGLIINLTDGEISLCVTQSILGAIIMLRMGQVMILWTCF